MTNVVSCKSLTIITILTIICTTDEQGKFVVSLDMGFFLTEQFAMSFKPNQELSRNDDRCMIKHLLAVKSHYCPSQLQNSMMHFVTPKGWH